MRCQLTQRGNSGIRVDFLEPILLLLIFKDIDSLKTVVQAKLLQKDRYLPACDVLLTPSVEIFAAVKAGTLPDSPLGVPAVYSV